MARIAFAWELGSSYGHTIASAGLARSLQMRGHAIAFMFRELRQLAVIPEAAHADVFQAPGMVVEGAGEAIPASYADILLGCGYRDPSVLAGLLGGWRTLLARWQADLVVADFSPTALLAAQSLGIPRVTYGNGFFTPPALTPLPAFRHEAPVDPERLARSDAIALTGVNGALARHRAAPLPTLASMFAVTEDFLCTFPELDHYGSRPTSGYWGPRLRYDLGTQAAWPRGNGPRVFVYLQRTLPQVDPLIDALAAAPYRVLAYIPDLEAERRRRLDGRTRQLLDRPVRMDAVFRECDLLVCAGGEIAGGAVACGVPVLVIPQHYEQYLTAARIEQLGAGAWLAPRSTRRDLDAALDALTGDSRYRTAARLYAGRYPAYSPEEQRRRIVQRVEAILSPSSAPRGPAP